MATPIVSITKFQTLPESYVLPPSSRPGKFVPVCKEIPVLDLGQAGGAGRAELVQQVLKACQEFGLFQVINHGVSETTMQEAMKLYKDFFDMSDEEKLPYCSHDPAKVFKFYPSSLNFAQEATHYWRESILHLCHPLDKYTPHWPDKPSTYREVIGKYSAEVRKMGLAILDLIGEGIGLNEAGFEGKQLSEKQEMLINHYPACPDPSLTMGLPGHLDPNLVTLIQQEEVYGGLQLLKDGQWLGVEPLPTAFVVVLGYLTETVSNGKIKGIEHRVITDVESRTSIGTFIGPLEPVVVEPAKELLTSNNPPLFKPFVYGEYLDKWRRGLPNYQGKGS